MTIALTGTSGNIGRRVLRKLDGSHVVIGRDASKLPDGHDKREASYDNTGAMTAALHGVDTLFFVSGRESADRLEQHYSVVDAAAAAGVTHIVYLSFLGNSADGTFTFGRHHYFTEQRIRQAGLSYTFLQDSLYADYLPLMTGADGVIRGPAGAGRVSAVSTDDVVDVAATVLSSIAAGESTHNNRAYKLTGPEALTLDEVAAQLSHAAGVPVQYLNETEEEAYASRASYGAPHFEVEGWVTSYQAIGNNEIGEVSDDIERLTGHPAQSFAQFLKKHPESYSHLL